MKSHKTYEKRNLAKVPPGPFSFFDFKSLTKMKLNKKNVSIIGAALFGIAILLVIFLIYPFNEVISTFTNFTPLLVLAYLFFSVLIIVSMTLRWNVIVRAFGYKVPFHKLVGYKVVGYGISYITPSAKVGGEPVRAALLKRHGIGLKKDFPLCLLTRPLTCRLQ